MLYPPHTPLASTSSSSLDIDDKHPTDFAPGIRVIQLVEIPAPPRAPRALPPSSASSTTLSSAYSSSACSSSAYSSSVCSADNNAAEDEAADEGSYCSSMDDGEEEDEERAREREAAALKVRRILTWRAQLAPASPPSPTPVEPALSPVPIVLAPPALSSRKRSSSSSEAEGSRASKRSRTSPSASPSPSPSPSISPHHVRMTMDDDDDDDHDTPIHRQPALLLTPPSPTALALARRHTSPRSSRPRFLSPSPLPSSPSSPPTHHRTRSLLERGETVCPACDRQFVSARAFRMHALAGDAMDETKTACGAAVAYALEEARGAV